MDSKEQKKADAKKSLLDNYIKQDVCLLIVIKSVSASGILRRMRVYVDGGQFDITELIADLCGLSLNSAGLLVKGCGMDMAYWLADRITAELYRPKLPKWLDGRARLDYKVL